MSTAVDILIVDDEPQIHRFLGPSLTASGYRAMSVKTAAEALAAVAARAPDLVILDLGLPDRDGKEVIAQIRKRSAVPIIILSARDRESEKIEALDLGADDYVNKPFGIGELLARIRSVLRRPAATQPEAPEVFDHGAIHMDLRQHTLTRDGTPIHLTPREFELFALMLRHAGRVLTHRYILNEVWGPANTTDTQYLRVFIGQLRQKLEENPAEPKIILTEPGVGYRIADMDPESKSS